jgi:hypothetical protein
MFGSAMSLIKSQRYIDFVESAKCNFCQKECLIANTNLHLVDFLVTLIIYLFLFSAFTMFIGITFPFFGGLLGFFGGFAFAPTTYFVS